MDVVTAKKCPVGVVLFSMLPPYFFPKWIFLSSFNQESFAMVKAKSLRHKRARHFRPLQLKNCEEYEGKNFILEMQLILGENLKYTT